MSAHINQLIQDEIAQEQAHYHATLLRTLLLMGLPCWPPCLAAGGFPAGSCAPSASYSR